MKKENTMKKSILALLVLSVFALLMASMEASAQMGPGMMGRGPMMGPGGGYGMGPGMMGGWVAVPEKLPPPKNVEWVQKLREVLLLEKKSYLQYTTDADKYNAAMPYMMVIPQEEDHVELIERLFAAYGLPADGNPGPAVETKSLREAFELCARMEEELISRYAWLVQKAEDQDSAQVLNQILLQTRWHLAMFQHALGMGGYGMGPGMMRGYGMGRGMRGYGMGPGMMGPGVGYGSLYPPLQKPLTEKEAKSRLENYLQSSRNPNLKLGKIEDKGAYFEAEVLTKNDALVDKVLVDKNTGWMRSVY
jgi:hypothetical protein